MFVVLDTFAPWPSWLAAAVPLLAISRRWARRYFTRDGRRLARRLRAAREARE